MESVGQAARYPSPLRYPGGKGKIVNYLKLLILENSLSGIEYVEPYAGGASVALSLLYEGYVERIQINDLNPGVFHFWSLVTTDADWLCDRILTVPLTMHEWQRQKSLYDSGFRGSSRDLGFATFYLNRTNRSGIIARGSVIGGLDQSGKWGIDARFNRESLFRRVQKVARFAPRIAVTNLDALALLKNESQRASQRLLYLDPPYYIKGSRLYDNFYDHSDHLAISRAMSSLPGPWIVSYDAADQITEMYCAHNSIRYTLAYSASVNESGPEVMFFSSDLQIPDCAPNDVSSSRIRSAKSSLATLF